MNKSIFRRLVDASLNGRYQEVSQLLEAGACERAKCKSILLASSNGHIEVVKLLLLHKANIEERYFNHGGSFHQYFLKQYPYGSILASPFNSFCLIGIEMITNHSCELTRLCYQMFTAL